MSSENGLDSGKEDGLEVMENGNDKIPNVGTKSKEPAVDQNSDNDNSAGKEEEAMDSPLPKKKGRKALKVKNESKQNVNQESKADEEIGNKLPASKRGKKKENSAENSSNGEIEEKEEASEQKEELIKEPASKPKSKKKEIGSEISQETKKNGNNEEADQEEETEPVKETRKSTRRGIKRKLDNKKDIEEKKDVIYQSIVDEVHNITEDPSALKNTEPENSPKKVKEIKETKPAVAKTKIKNPTADDVKVEANLPTGWIKKLVVRKSGVTKGQKDVYIYSPDGIKLRSKPELEAFLKRKKSSLKLSDFDFSRKDAQGAALAKSSPKKVATPGKKKVDAKKSLPPKKNSKALSKVEAPKKSPKTKKGGKQSKIAVKKEAKSLKATKNKKK